MGGRYAIATLLILGIALAWIGVQYLYRRFAWRHPEFGPVQERVGCGMSCTCEEPCENRTERKRTPEDRAGNPLAGDSEPRNTAEEDRA